jgi:hypothetical protein
MKQRVANPGENSESSTYSIFGIDEWIIDSNDIDIVMLNTGQVSESSFVSSRTIGDCLIHTHFDRPDRP